MREIGRSTKSRGWPLMFTVGAEFPGYSQPTPAFSTDLVRER